MYNMPWRDLVDKLQPAGAVYFSMKEEGNNRHTERKEKRGEEQRAEREEKGMALVNLIFLDVQTVMRFKQTMIGSDGLFFDLHPHPRLWGTF